MKNAVQKQIPPYEGNDPYLYLAFAEADAKAVRQLLIPLVTRGCRVWYCTGKAGSAEALLHRQERAAGAALTVLYMTNAACSDTDTKSYVLVNQKNNRPILCLDPDGKDRRLTMGLRETIPHVSLYECSTSAEKEQAILHADGFSQQLLGQPMEIKDRGLVGRLSGILCILTLLLVLAAVAFTRLQPKQEDTVFFRDPVVYSAVKDSVGGAALTEELVAQITRLELDAAPESWEDLALLPGLERVILPQQALLDGCTLPEGNYTIELSGGGA